MYARAGQAKELKIRCRAIRGSGSMLVGQENVAETRSARWCASAVGLPDDAAQPVRRTSTSASARTRSSRRRPSIWPRPFDEDDVSGFVPEGRAGDVRRRPGGRGDPPLTASRPADDWADLPERDEERATSGPTMKPGAPKNPIRRASRSGSPGPICMSRPPSAATGGYPRFTRHACADECQRDGLDAAHQRQQNGGRHPDERAADGGTDNSHHDTPERRRRQIDNQNARPLIVP